MRASGPSSVIAGVGVAFPWLTPGIYYTPDDILSSHHLPLTNIPPTCERTHPTRPEETLDSALRNHQAILRHRFHSARR